MVVAGSIFFEKFSCNLSFFFKAKKYLYRGKNREEFSSRFNKRFRRSAMKKGSSATYFHCSGNGFSGQKFVNTLIFPFCEWLRNNFSDVT